jgi:hypothetical protein
MSRGTSRHERVERLVVCIHRQPDLGDAGRHSRASTAASDGETFLGDAGKNTKPT